jgi:hypothetical protein
MAVVLSQITNVNTHGVINIRISNLTNAHNSISGHLTMSVSASKLGEYNIASYSHQISCDQTPVTVEVYQ